MKRVEKRDEEREQKRKEEGREVGEGEWVRVLETEEEREIV